MYRIYIAFLLSAGILYTGCTPDTLLTLDNEGISRILSLMDENDPAFREKEVAFDSIVSYTGIRTYQGNEQNIKVKLFYFGDRMRGYFNLRDQDDKNLQVFGKMVGGYKAFKCMTTVNMEEAGGYMILDEQNEGIWSNGHINFEKEQIHLKKSVRDYNDLTAN